MLRCLRPPVTSAELGHRWGQKQDVGSKPGWEQPEFPTANGSQKPEDVSALALLSGLTLPSRRSP